MLYSHSDSKYDYYTDVLNESIIRITVDKMSKEIFINTNDLSRALGYKDFSEMLLQNEDAQDVFFENLKNGNVLKMINKSEK
jgi:hypothetical protein